MLYTLIYSDELKEIQKEFPELNDSDGLILVLNKKGWSYGDIQQAVGCPPKKYIKTLIAQYCN